ncbi:ABC transporter substrate-binding protein [Faecalicatena orotica]|uniref:ABC transporter substrate-binding protein n=2 Tax=Bacillota TaxID=1239 RepID=UPI0032178CF5
MKGKRIIGIGMAVMLCISCAGCQKTSGKGTYEEKNLKKITISIKTPPIGVGNIPGIGEAEIYDLFVDAFERFKNQYDKYDVDLKIGRYNYVDEKEQLADKYGTDEAADIFFSGSYNTPTYVSDGWLIPLDDIIDEDLQKDIDENIWEQCSIDGQVYVMPFQQLQNTLLVNKEMMERAGLDEYIPAEDTIAQWSTKEFNVILQRLQETLDPEKEFVLMMYAANNQGDSHIMTLLRAYGGTLYDEEGDFAVDTPEGIAALEWLKDLNDKGITPKGAENMELIDCVNLFNNGQMALCMGNLTNLWDIWDKGLDVFAANFPSMDGKGYATSSVNGFCIFDNGNEDKIQAAKDFIRYIYTDEDLMKYTLGTLPVNHSVTEKYQDEIRMLKAYGDNTPNIVDNIRNNLNWQGVRDVFYLNIKDLLLEKKTPAEVAAGIDQSCNTALSIGRGKEK